MAQASDTVPEHSRFLVGPWDHSAYYNHRETYSGERNFAVATGPRFLSPMILNWFDHWLKGEDIQGRGEVADFMVLLEGVGRVGPAGLPQPALPVLPEPTHHLLAQDPGRSPSIDAAEASAPGGVGLCPTTRHNPDHVDGEPAPAKTPTNPPPTRSSTPRA